MPRNRSSKSTILGRFALFGLSIGLGLFTFVTVVGVSVAVLPFIIGGIAGPLLSVDWCNHSKDGRRETTQPFPPAKSRGIIISSTLKST